MCTPSWHCATSAHTRAEQPTPSQDGLFHNIVAAIFCDIMRFLRSLRSLAICHDLHDLQDLQSTAHYCKLRAVKAR
eukprot:6789533-Prymnesium_polylepis.1